MEQGQPSDEQSEVLKGVVADLDNILKEQDPATISLTLSDGVTIQTLPKEDFLLRSYEPDFSPEYTDPEIFFALEYIQLHCVPLPQEVVFPVPWPASDAAFQQFLELLEQPATIKRTDLSAGSVSYQISVTTMIKDMPLGSFKLRVTADQKAHIVVLENRELHNNQKARILALSYLKWHLRGFGRWLKLDTSHLQQVEEATKRSGQRVAENMEPIPLKMWAAVRKAVTPKRRGPAPSEHTLWAREQIRLGRSLEDILDGYMERQGMIVQMKRHVDEHAKPYARLLRVISNQNRKWTGFGHIRMGNAGLQCSLQSL